MAPETNGARKYNFCLPNITFEASLPPSCLVQEYPYRYSNETFSKSVDSWTEFAPLNANEPDPNANEFCREVPFMGKNWRFFFRFRWKINDI